MMTNLAQRVFYPFPFFCQLVPESQDPVKEKRVVGDEVIHEFTGTWKRADFIATCTSFLVQFNVQRLQPLPGALAGKKKPLSLLYHFETIFEMTESLPVLVISGCFYDGPSGVDMVDSLDHDMDMKALITFLDGSFGKRVRMYTVQKD